MLISVVIPVYNVEKYLSQCLDSVINQTYKNLEIICVDDSSTDNSLEILKEYAQKDTRIKIIKNEKNLGLGLTRNEGVKVAKGEYIHFLDSDDWMNLNAYEKLFDTVKKINFPDVITFSYFSHNQITGKIKKIRLAPNKNEQKTFNIYETPECLKYWTSSAWVKFLKRTFILENSLKFNDYRCYEDIAFSIESVLKAKSIYFLDEYLLNYRADRKDSLLEKQYLFLDHIVKDIKWTEENTRFLPHETQKAILKYSYRFLIGSCSKAYERKKIEFDELKKYIVNLNLNVLNNNLLYNKERYWFCKLILSCDKYTFFIIYKIVKIIKKLIKIIN